MKNAYNFFISATFLSTALITTPVSAAVYEFHFTGKYTLIDAAGNYADQQAISSTLTYDDNSGSGFSSGMTIANFDTFGATATIYDISLQRDGTSNLIIGNMLVNWAGTTGIPLSMVWDASGLFNAIDFGLQAGDVISGTNLKRNGAIIADVNSATPASDGMATNITPGSFLNQGPAPLAVTTWNTTTLCTPGIDCMSNALSGGAPFFNDGISGSPLIDGPFPGFYVNFDIGSGNSLTLLNVSTVPVPTAAWLFASGLIGLTGFAKRKAT